MHKCTRTRSLSSSITRLKEAQTIDQIYDPGSRFADPPPPNLSLRTLLHLQENPNPHHATGGDPPRHRKGEPLGGGGGEGGVEM